MRPSGQGKATYVQAMFARIVPKYDLMNTLMTAGMDRQWRRTAARVAYPKGGLALDVGTGTGELALELARQGARAVIGVDFVREMLEVGRAKVVQHRLSDRVSFVVGDAQRLPFPDGSFDCVTNGFLLRNVADLKVTFAEFQRVLKPGGRLVCLEITHPPTWLAPFFRAYFYGFVPLLGSLVTGQGNAYRYLPHSLTPFPTADGLAQLMREAGLTQVRYRRLGLGTVTVHVGQKPGKGRSSNPLRQPPPGPHEGPLPTPGPSAR